MITSTSSSFSNVLKVALCGGCLWIGGCAVGPDYKRPDVAVPTAFKNAAPVAANGPATAVTDTWWTLFEDDDLTRLSQEALQANLDIKAAMARVDEARAATRSSSSSFFPSLDLAPSLRRGRSTSGVTNSTYTLPLDLSYEIDIWGRLRRDYEYYHNLDRASAEDLVVVRQTALADLAQGYFTLRLYEEQTDIVTKAIELYRRQMALTESKANAGFAPKTDVLQVQNLIDQAETQLIEIQRSRAKQETAISLLVARPPSEFSLERRLATAHLPQIPAGLPASLLNRRPDVMEAEHKLVAANAKIGAAKADFYPTLSLTGAAGFESLDVNNLTNWQNRIWSVSPGLTLPIFEGGKLRAGLAQARASYEEQLAVYQSTVLGAYRDVENELSDIRLLTQEIAAIDKTLGSAKENVRLTELQYKQGLSSALQLITANQTELSAELSKASAENERLTASVLLIKAIGGGWESDAEPKPAK